MSWKSQLDNSISTVDELALVLSLGEIERQILRDVCDNHPLKISRYYFSLIDKNDKRDPLRRIAVPLTQESHVEGTDDTSGEKTNTVFQGLQHKYAQTVVILSTNECAMYCRHCFRKRLVGRDTEETLQNISLAVQYVKEHKEVTNVLITGGDPLVLSNARLQEFLDAFADIDHLNFIRFGTRVPVTFPQRITGDSELLEMLARYSNDRKRIYFVTQFNHPREITEKSSEAIGLLADAGIITGNQTVLLKGVNDNPEIMSSLQKGLVQIGVIPYYIFQCRPVKHVKKQFQVPLYEGCQIIQKAFGKLDGHEKRAKFIMSHRTGKIEILGIYNDLFLFKYHQAKNPDNIGKIFARRVDRTSTWLDDLAA